MAAYVVDASVVIAALLTTEVYTANAEALFNQIAAPDQLYVSVFCKVECTNVLWKQVRFHGMLQVQAEQLVKDLHVLDLTIYDSNDLYLDALQVGIRYQLAIYDSIYIALAKRLNYPLITADQKQAGAAKAESVTLKPVTDFVS